MITELTPAQTKLMPKIRDQWISIGLDTSPMDWDRAKSAVRKAYRRAGLKPPKEFLCFDSPLQGWTAVALANLVQQQNGAVRGAVLHAVGDAVVDAVWNAVWNAVGDTVWDTVWDAVGGAVWGAVSHAVRGTVRGTVRDAVRDAVWGAVSHAVGDAVWVQACWSQHDAGWLSFYRFFHEAKICDCSKLEGLWATAKYCGWWWPFENVCVITAKPCLLKRDQQGRLHSETSMAIQYPDGWGLWRWHGVAVAEDTILHPELITTEMIDQEQNQEVKRVLIERYGEERYLDDTGAEKVHEDDYGILFRKEIEGGDPLVVVRVVNPTPEPDGTHKIYFLPVHPELRPMQRNGTLGELQAPTARNAVASTWGMIGEEFQPEQRA